MLIIHGEDSVASRNYFLSLPHTTILDGQQITIDDLYTALNNTSLLGETTTIFVENLFSKKPLVAFLQTNIQADIVVWEKKTVTTDLPNKRFDLPKYIFKFLDNPSVELLHLCLKSSPAEMLFASLATRAHKQGKIEWIKSLLDIDYKIKT